MASVFLRSWWYILGLGSLVLTIFFGALYRFQFAGLHFTQLQDFNLHQTHTHLGFYGAIASLAIAASIHTFKEKRTNFLFFLYVVLLTSSLIGFFVDGYNLVTKIISFFIYLFWIFISLKGLSAADIKEKPWRWISCCSLVLAAIFLFTIIYQGKEVLYFETAKLVKAFLLTLLLGYFTPMALLRLRFHSPGVALWVVLTLLAAVGLVFPGANLLNSLCMTLLALITALKQRGMSLPTKSKAPLAWLLLAGGLVIFNFFHESHYMGIASLHYWILGPLVLSFVQFKIPFLETVYSMVLLLFIILLMALEPAVISFLKLDFQRIQLLASGLGMLLSVLMFMEFIFYVAKRSSYEASSKSLSSTFRT